MNASLFMLATILATQSGNQVSGTITNNTDIFSGMPYSIIFPKGNGSVSGPVTFFFVKTCAGNYNISNVFVVNNAFPNTQSSTTGLDANKGFNWQSNSYNKPNYPITVKGTIQVYQDNPPVTKFETFADKLIN